MVGNRAPHPRAVTIAEVFEQIAPLAQSALDSQHKLSLKPPKTDKHWLLDAGQLMDALLNLILNARDAIGKEGTITLAAKIVKDTWIEFVVTDTGPGFSDNALQHAFDPFFTTKGEHGTGLGLSMVYDVAKMNGGSLVLQNGFRGARVTLRLPARQAIAEHPPGMALLVEDQTDLRDVFRSYLTGMGYSVIEASGVDEARALVTRITRNHPDFDRSTAGRRRNRRRFDQRFRKHQITCSVYVITPRGPPIGHPCAAHGTCSCQTI